MKAVGVLCVGMRFTAEGKGYGCGLGRFAQGQVTVCTGTGDSVHRER